MAWGWSQRPAKPRDKPKVEAGVLLVERWILAALRHRRFRSLSDLNMAIAELLDRLNERSFRRREGSRRSVFESLDRAALRVLPAERRDSESGAGRALTSIITLSSSVTITVFPTSSPLKP
jgi:hypothetical protein